MASDTRRNILQATLELLWLHSYGSVSVDDICTRAGVRKGSFYHYFPSKVDVVVEAFESYWQENQSLLDEVFSARYSPEERIARYAELVYQRQKEKYDEIGKVAGCALMTTGSELSTTEERIRLKVGEVFCRGTAYFRQVLQDSGHHAATAEMEMTQLAEDMMSYTLGLVYHAKVRNNLEIVRERLKPGLLRYLGQGVAIPAIHPPARTADSDSLSSFSAPR
jgi:TetR/AcrR family transcriptional repressor of nem operon